MITSCLKYLQIVMLGCMIGIIMPACAYAQNNIHLTIDSINREAERQFNVNFPRAFALASHACYLALQNHDTKGLIAATCTRSVIQANMSHTREALAALHALHITTQHDKASCIKVSTAMGACWAVSGNNDSARLYYERAITLSTVNSDLHYYVQACVGLAKVYLKLGSADRALEYYELAERAAHTKANEEDAAWVIQLMGEILYAQRLYDKALVHLDQGYHLFQKLQHLRGMASAMLYKGNIYYMQVKDDGATAGYTLALQYFASLADSGGMAICYSNLSRIYLEAGKTTLAITYANKALETIGNGNYNTIEAGTYQQLGDIYGELKEYNKAVSYVQQALIVARKGDDKMIVKDCYKSLSELYEAMHRPQLALEHLRAAYRIKDSIVPVTFTRQLAEMEARFATEKKETEIKLLKQQGQIGQLKMQEQKISLQKQRYLLLSLLIIIAAIGIAMYYYVARRRLQEQVRRQQTINETEEIERIRIAKDIHDELGSGLSKIRFLAEVANAHTTGREQLTSSLHAISDTSKGLVENMRDMVWAMNPENTTLANLVARIREYSYDYLEEFPIELEFDFPEEVPDRKISKETTRNVYMIVKEALQNIVKHAAATKVKMIITVHPAFRLQVQDNGKGYDAETVVVGNGLRNMAARAHALGGNLNSHTHKENGTTIELIFNLQ